MFQETQEREERNLCLVKQKKPNGTDPPTSGAWQGLSVQNENG